jgi:allantoinase
VPHGLERLDDHVRGDAIRGVTGTRVVRPGGVGPGTVLFDGERIAAVVEDRRGEPGILDAGHLIIAPGLVDSHVHVNEPGRTEWEGFATATRAAAAGGVTTIVDMPLNSSPVTTTREALDAKLAASQGQRRVDVAFWAGVVPGNALRLAELARGGVVGAKAFMVHSGIDEFPGVAAADLRAAMAVLRDLGLPLLAHAEIDLGSAAAAGGDPRSYTRYAASRPAAWEQAAIALLIDLCRETGCAVHVVHLAAASAVPMLRRARAEGLPITVETCPHYLCLEAEAIADGATAFKCAPPIRDRANRGALWAALLEGVIDAVVSDHSPCPPALKRLDTGDFTAAWGGIASLQLGLPVVWTEARRRGIGVERLAAWMSDAPARLAGQAGRKGRLEAGYDADIVIWDPDASFTVDPAALQHRHPVSPYAGATLHGVVHRTILRGREVFDGRAFPSGPIGQLLLHRREAA